MVLAMGLLTDLPIRQVFKAARRLRKGEESPHHLPALLRRPSAVGRGAGAAPVPPSRSSPGPAGDTGGVLRRLAVDGARRHDLRRPRLGGQRDHLHRPSAGPRGEGALHQVRKLSFVSWGPMSKWPMVVRSSAHGERRSVAGLFRHLTSEMLLLWDRGFFSYELWQQMTAHR